MEQPKLQVAYAVRFVAFGTIMAFVNIAPYLLTRGTPAYDGVEMAGWPLTCYELGGFNGHFYFKPLEMFINIEIAVVVAAFLAWIFRNGVLHTIRNWARSGERNILKHLR